MRVRIAVFAAGSAPLALLPVDLTRPTDFARDVCPGPRVWPLTSQAVFVFSLRRRMACGFPCGKQVFHDAVAGRSGDGLSCALGLFRSSMTLLWGGTEVSCQARPARFLLRLFLPTVRSRRFWDGGLPRAAVFLFLPLQGSPVIIPVTCSVARALLAADETVCPLVPPQERPLLGRAGSR